MKSRFSSDSSQGQVSILSFSFSGLGGGGARLRTRSVVVGAANGGLPCPSLFDGELCNSQPCSSAVNCVLSSWSNWGSCSLSCGSGTRERSRRIVQAATNGGTCGSLTQSESCDMLCRTTPSSTPLPELEPKPVLQSELTPFLRHSLLPIPELEHKP